MNSRRDYKSAATGPRRQRARRNGLLVVTLILIGLFGGLLAYIRGDRPQPPPIAAVPATPTQPPAAPAAAPAPKVVVAPAAEPDPARPKYDFYTELPKRQIDVQPEAAKSRNAPQPAPARMQPAVNQRHNPPAPRGNAKTSTPNIAAASSSKTANAKTANAKTTDAKTVNAKTANAKTANAKTANAKTVIVEPASSKSTATGSRTAPARTATTEPASSKSTATGSRATPAKPTNATPAPPATPPARTTSPTRPIANAGSKVVVKTE